MKKFLMGNEAIALGAIRANVDLVCGYPGTPSTEVLETAAKQNDGSYYVEWSVNEKVAMEVAAGAAYAGARALVTMKQVGLNVAADPLMSLAYVGVEGGMVVLVADDPGPISSQTEQDTRMFGQFAKIPVLDPATPEEAYWMIQDAFALSEEQKTPVILRSTTRVCHGCEDVEVGEPVPRNPPRGFVRDTARWVIFPRLAYENHKKVEARNQTLSQTVSQSHWNPLTRCPGRKKAVVAGGVSRQYVLEYQPEQLGLSYLQIGIPFPFPEELALSLLREVEEVLVLEELSPYLERELVYLCGKHHLPCRVYGKLTGHVQNAGENTAKSVREQLYRFAEKPLPDFPELGGDTPPLPVRPPVLCAGCPHRASFYAVKKAMKGKKAVFCGDIGCYTLGNAQPLDMVDTCLCMGADVTIAQGLRRMEPDTVPFSFIGDSTFFASGIPGVINAVYNGTDMVLIVLDNSTTAMTGQQEHPGTGKTMMGVQGAAMSIEKILEAVGVASVEVLSPLQLDAAVDAVRRAADGQGVRAVIFRSPCIAKEKPSAPYVVEQTCTGCRKCLREIGCPAIAVLDGKVVIERHLCFGCDLCAQICPIHAIQKEGTVQ